MLTKVTAGSSPVKGLSRHILTGGKACRLRYSTVPLTDSAGGMFQPCRHGEQKKDFRFPRRLVHCMPPAHPPGLWKAGVYAGRCPTPRPLRRTEGGWLKLCRLVRLALSEEKLEQRVTDIIVFFHFSAVALNPEGAAEGIIHTLVRVKVFHVIICDVDDFVAGQIKRGCPFVIVHELFGIHMGADTLVFAGNPLFAPYHVTAAFVVAEKRFALSRERDVFIQLGSSGQIRPSSGGGLQA